MLKLTDREMSVYKLLTKGLCDKDIAKELGIAIKTAKSHVSNILKKRGFKSRFQLIARSKPDSAA